MESKLIRRGGVLAFCLLVILSGASPGWLGHGIAAPLPARGGLSLGEGVRVYGITQLDLDGDGAIDVTIIDCAFATDRDRVYVYDRSGDMPRGDRWEDVVDFDDDIWLFDVGATGQISLAIVFDREDGHDVAYLYDDQDGDGRVKVRLNGKQIVIEESPYWSAKVVSGSTWWLPDGSLNQNAHFWIDGPLAPVTYPRELLRKYRTSGEPKWEAEVVDADGDGIPEYSYLRLLADSPVEYGLPRTGVQVNVGQHRPSAPFGYVFWPLLNGSEEYAKGNYFDTPYHLIYDWTQRQIVGVGVEGYPIEHGYHINTLSYFTKEGINRPSFEAPMAYYDLAEDHDGLPELFIRVAYFPKGEIYMLNKPTPETLEEVSVSWNQRNIPRLRWDYKLGLLGRNHVDDVFRVGDFLINMVPHWRAPDWVNESAWDVVTFVADEGGGFDSSEGIYDWAPMEEAESGRYYVIGESIIRPAATFTSIREGMRGEYAELNDRVNLYFSPVDRRLHLERAEFGLWNLGEGRRLRTSSLGTDHIAQWSLWQGDQPVRSLWQVAGQLILADEAGVRLRRVDVPPALFTVRPPMHHDEWVRQGELLAKHRSQLAGDDLAGMFDQFAGAVETLPGAALHDLRLTDDGFRFILELATVDTTAPAWAAGLAPGRYVVEYAAATGYHVAPATPPTLRLESLEVVGDVPVAFYPVELLARVRNEGGEDAHGVPVVLTAAHAGQATATLETPPLELRAGETRDIRFTWTPPVGGNWTVGVDASDGSLSSTAVVLEVANAPETGVGRLLTAQRFTEAGGPVVALLLLCVAGLAGGLGAAFITGRRPLHPGLRVRRRESPR